MAKRGENYEVADGSTHEWQHNEDGTVSANADVTADLVADTESDGVW